MKTTMLLWCLGLFALVLFAQKDVSGCECLGIFERGPYFCHSTGCMGEYYTESCGGGGGCIYGGDGTHPAMAYAAPSTIRRAIYT